MLFIGVFLSGKRENCWFPTQFYSFRWGGTPHFTLFSTQYWGLIKSCTRVQMYFTVTEPEAKSLSELAGQETVWLKSVGEATTRLPWRRQRSHSLSYLEARQERLPMDQIMQVSSDPRGMIAYFALDAGTAQFGGRPVLVRTLYPLPQALYEARLQAAWPAAAAVTAGAIPVTTGPGTSAAPTTGPPAEPASVVDQMEALLATQLAA
jgi:hypothetical protein